MSDCILCGEPLPIESFLSLQGMPSCAQNIPDKDSLRKDRGMDLDLFQCGSCGLVQLDCSPVPYYRDVIRAGGGTKTMTDMRRLQYGHFIDKCSLAGKRILEVGCGQGEFLEMLKGFNVQGFGIENNQQLVDLATKKGLSVYRDFAGDGIHTLPGAPYDAFMQFNFIEHQPDPNGMVRCIRENLVPMGVGLVTAPSFEYIRNDCVYEVMRDHLAYYSERTLSFLFEKNGFDVLERGIVNKDTVYVVVRRQEHLTRDTFRTNYRQIKDDLNLFVDNMTEDGRRLAFWGASHQCFTAASFLNRPDKVESIVDSAKFKQGKFSPASHIPIVAPEQFFASPSDALLILAPGYTDEIAATVTLHTSAVKLFALRSDKIEELN